MSAVLMPLAGVVLGFLLGSGWSEYNRRRDKSEKARAAIRSALDKAHFLVTTDLEELFLRKNAVPEQRFLAAGPGEPLPVTFVQPEYIRYRETSIQFRRTAEEIVLSLIGTDYDPIAQVVIDLSHEQTACPHDKLTKLRAAIAEAIALPTRKVIAKGAASLPAMSAKGNGE